jgi:hypothetical protein
MRQIGDLAVWVGMIGLAVGVIHYAPVVAEYVTAEPKPRFAPVPATARAYPTMSRPHYMTGERHAAR